jgi:sulfate transport system substrate-binding protein
VPTGQGSREDVLTIGAYSVVREVLHEALLPAFAARWKNETGRDVRFEESYNGSGAQSRAIAAGFDADIAILSLEDDVTPLVKAGLVSEKWNKGPDKGMVTRSLVVVAVRPGNPKGIHDWLDLAKPDVGVLYPDPKTSGGARWNINAIYGAGLLGDGKKDIEAARRLLTSVQANVVNMDSSGRQSLATFERGIGDAAVTYENELRLRLSRGGSDAGLESIVPPRTLLIEGPAAVVDASVERHGNRRLAQAFLDFLRDKEGQAILADYGFRPLDEAPPPGTFTMSDLGGWSKVKADVYGSKGLWTSIFTERERVKKGGSR